MCCLPYLLMMKEQTRKFKRWNYMIMQQGMLYYIDYCCCKLEEEPRLQHGLDITTAPAVAGCDGQKGYAFDGCPGSIYTNIYIHTIH